MEFSSDNFAKVAKQSIIFSQSELK